MQTAIDLGAKHGKVQYDGISSSTISNRIGQIAKVVRDRVKQEFSSVRFISSTLDHWTCSVNKLKYLAMNVIYYNKSNIINRNLMLKEVESKLSRETRSTFDDQIFLYQIEKKVVYVVTDNANDMKAAFANSSIIWFGCAVHQLQLVLKHSLNDLTDSSDVKRQIQLVRDLIGYVNHANKQNLFQIKLKQEVATRFDSVYLMINLLVDNKNILPSINDEEIRIYLKKIDIDLICKIKLVLQLFYDVRIKLSCSTSPTLNLVYPLKQRLIHKLSENKENDDSRLKRFKTKLIKHLEEDLVVNDYHLAATFLTPRFKSSQKLFSAEKKIKLYAF